MILNLTLRTLALVLCCSAVAGTTAHGAEPKLTVPKSKLAAALKCTPDIKNAKRTPIMFVTGTGASGDEGYAIGKPAFDKWGAPVCWVNFPNNTTADIQVSVQYLVYGLRTMARRADRKVAVFGISQGGLLPRVALTYWPSLARKVSDVLAAAGTQHGTTVSSRRCSAKNVCTPAGWQQSAGSKFIKALNRKGRDETPGPTAWTTVRSKTDETVQPTTGPRPTSSLAGATNVMIQSVCPGRKVSHIGTALDSVTFALFKDAITHRGPAKVSRLPKGVCSQRYASGLDQATAGSLIDVAGGLTGSRSATEPTVKREPKVRNWMKRR